MKTQAELIQELKRLGYLKSERIEAALKKVDRRDFVPEDLRIDAYVNAPLPIGFGQTTSQPLTIVFMLELAGVKVGDRVLEIGTGSGWQTALLAELVGPRGVVVSIERIKEIHRVARTNLTEYSYPNIELLVGDGTKGYNKTAPYDVIIAGAEANKIPLVWEDQIAISGRIVLPVNSSVYRVIKEEDGQFRQERHYGFAFVPLIEDR